MEALIKVPTIKITFDEVTEKRNVSFTEEMIDLNAVSEIRISNSRIFTKKGNFSKFQKELRIKHGNEWLGTIDELSKKLFGEASHA